MRQEHPELPTWARVADAAAGMIFLAGLLLAVFGGFRMRVAGVRLSLTSPWRVLVWAVVLVLVRHAIDRRQPIYQRLFSGWHGLRQSPEFRTAWPIFIWSRIAVILVGYFAVVTIGFPVPESPLIVYENQFANLLARWDTGWYLQIATRGYSWDPNVTHQQTVAFFPAYPMLMRIVGRLIGGRWLVAGAVVSIGAFLWALIYLFRLAREDVGDEAAAAALLLLAAYPFSIFYSAAYTESLFLLAAVAAFYDFRRDRLVAASAWGLLAGLTRPNGCFLSVVLAVMMLETWRRPSGRPTLMLERWRRPLGRPTLAGLKPGATDLEAGLEPGATGLETRPKASATVARLAAAAMPGVGMLLFSGFVYSLTGDPLLWSKAHAAWGRTYSGLDTLVMDRYRYIAANGFYEYTAGLPLDLLNGLAALFALALAWPVGRRLGLAAATFVLINVVPPMLAGGLLSMGRMTSVLFPIFIWLGLAVPERRRGAWAVAFAAGQGLNAALFFTWRPLY